MSCLYPCLAFHFYTRVGEAETSAGHAIWIGNLPPQTDLMSLVHHVCREAGGLESLFLISKSNCAFANFRDETSCVAAQQKLHDSKFQSVRLVSRLRKSTVEGTAGVAAPTGPAATGVSQGQAKEMEQVEYTPRPSEDNAVEVTPGLADAPQRAPLPDVGNQKDKFFVLKSLTVEDLELSVRTGIWATQSHNEHALNQAFQASQAGGHYPERRPPILRRAYADSLTPPESRQCLSGVLSQ